MDARAKIVSPEQAARHVRAAQAAGRTVVLCHGCFDLVHPGHVRHLQEARRLGDHLLVTITGDALLDKGTGRPLIPQEMRAENLAALDCVGWVTISPAPTAVELLEQLRPDVYVKGREYRDNRDPRFEAEKAVVEAYGGRLVFTSGEVVFSSTALIAAMEREVDPAHVRLEHLLEREALDEARSDAIVEGFRGRRIAVVGETLLDTYVMCDRPEVAGEGPLMTLRPIDERTFDGGAAVIARHLAAMGARPELVTVLPPDDGGVVARLEGEGVAVTALRHAGALGEMRRFLVGSTKVMKLDLARPFTLDEHGQAQMHEAAVDAARRADGLIIADHGQGLFGATTLRRLSCEVRPHTDLLVGDATGRRSNLLAMTGLDVLCPSEPELRDALHDYGSGLSVAAWRLLHETDARAAIVTLGANGAAAFERPGDAALHPDDWATRLHAEHVPALVPHAVDELGCGAALLAAVTLTRAAGGSMTLATILGQVAAAAEAQRLGNVAIGAADLRRGLRRLAAAHLAIGPPQLVTTRPSLTRDQLHPSHP